MTHNVMRGDGQGRVNYEIARHALDHGHRVWLIADRVDADLQVRGATWVPVRPRLRRIAFLKAAEFSVLAERAIRRMPEGVDVIHANGSVLTGRHQVNTCHFVHGAWLRSAVHTSRLRHDVYGLYHRLNSTLNAAWERRAYRHAKVVVAVSAQVQQQLCQVGVSTSSIRVVPNGVDPDEFYPGTEAREALGLPTDAPLVLFAGDLRSPIKNLDTLLRALARAPGIHLAVVGATHRSPYPELGMRLGISERLHFLGYRRDLPAIMRAVELFVLPSRYESFSLVILEAMASGLPVITSSAVGIADLVSPDCGVVLHDPENVDALASALISLMADPKRRAAMAAAGRATAERHTWKLMANRYLQLYAEVA